MSQNTICSAIAARHLVSFYYTGDKAVGYRTVEPHTLGYNRADHLMLNAWLVGGMTESDKSPYWRDYLLSEMSHIKELNEPFSGPRSGYRKGGGKKFVSVICDL
jgi:WYL domain